MRDLKRAPSLAADYEDLAALLPGTPQYDANVQRYVADWKTYWSEYVTGMMTTGAVPDGAPWGVMPALAGEVSSDASQTYHVLTHSFTPASLKGVLFLTSPEMVEAAPGPQFGEQLGALVKSWTEGFQSPGGIRLLVTVPSKTLAPSMPPLVALPHQAQTIPIDRWTDGSAVIEAILALP